MSERSKKARVKTRSTRTPARAGLDHPTRMALAGAIRVKYGGEQTTKITLPRLRWMEEPEGGSR